MILSLFYDKCSKTTFAVGLLQLMTAPYLIGWALSVYWGLMVVSKAFKFNIPFVGGG
jgi:hypothetical protein